MADKPIPPLNQNTPIVEISGKPKPAFVLLINQLLKGSVASALAIAQQALDAVNALIPRVDDLEDVDIIAGLGLSGGGMLGDGDVTLDLDAGLDDLTDVDTTSTPPTDGQVLGWDDALQLWVPVDQTGGGGGGGGALAIIGQAVVTSAQPTIDFTAIPGTYDDLVVAMSARGTNASNTLDVSLLFNGDTNQNNYGFQNTATSSTSGQNFGTDAASFIGRIPGASATSTAVGIASMVIPDYAGALGKAAVVDGGVRYDTTAGNFYKTNTYLYWKNTAAITDLQIILSSGNFEVGTVVTLYGRGGSGGGGGGTFNGARVHLTSNYNPSVGVDTPMLNSGSTVEYDTASWWDAANGWFVVPAGVTYVELQAQRACFGGGTTGLRMYRNTTPIALVGDTNQSFIQGVSIVACVAGDLIKPFIYGGGGYTLDASDPAFTWASVRALP